MSKLIKILTDKDVIGEDVDYTDRDFKYRVAARAVVYDEDGRIALMHISKDSFYKLPGGGLKFGEDLELTLKREIREEVGCDIGEVDELGHILEIKTRPDNDRGLVQLSHYYKTKVQGEKGDLVLEQDEIERGTELVWLKPEEIIEKMESYKGDNYEIRSIVLRDLEFCRYFLVRF